MNCLYITLFFNIVDGIVQTFIKSWNQLLYPRVIEVCRLPSEPRHDFFLHLIIIVTVQWLLLGFSSVVKKPMLYLQSQWSPEIRLLPVHSACETSAWNLAFGGTLDPRCHFKHVSLKQKPVLPLSNEHASQIKDQGRQHCCHNKHKKIPYWPTCDVWLLSGHDSYIGGTKVSTLLTMTSLVYITR